MNWECYVQNICKKIASALGTIKQIWPINLLMGHIWKLWQMLIWQPAVQPYFNYCGVIWGNCGSGLSEKLQKLQNHGACILIWANCDSNVDELFLALGWCKLKHQRFESPAVMTWDDQWVPSSRFVFEMPYIILIYWVYWK